MPRRPEPDEFADGFQITLVAKKLVGLFVLGRPAKTRRHRVNEHEVAGAKHGIVIVHKAERRRRQRAIGIHFHPTRTERAEVQPEGGRAGPAVEAKGNRSDGGVRFAEPRVGDIKDRGARRAIRLENWQHARLGHVFHGLAGDGDSVRGEDRLVRRIGYRGHVILGGLALVTLFTFGRVAFGGGRVGRGRIGRRHVVGVKGGGDGHQQNPS